MARIPDGATVAASNRLVPQLTDRCTVAVFGFPGIPLTSDWITDDTHAPMGWPLSPEDETQTLKAARDAGYRTVDQRDGYVLLRRPSAGPSDP
ncbi:DUF2079 domain-containing protein [Streptomyces katrae]|uniref:DUF2079 domain-containing protein n=1 Tax=Streptomyces katrae TaxID=68223 RepID=UPI0004BF8252|nr:DUF2079 domain-containing protein [Streptomyces katrae]